MTAILGSTGTGKTTLLKKLISSRPRVILLDTMGDDAAFGGWGAEVGSYSELADYAHRTDIFHLRWKTPQRAYLTIDAASHLAMKLGDVTLAVDEVHFFLTKQWNAIPPSFNDACLVGRHRNASVIVTSQRPTLVHNNFLSQAHKWYVFRMVLKDDLDSLKHLIPNIYEAQNLKLGKSLEYPP